MPQNTISDRIKNNLYIPVFEWIADSGPIRLTSTKLKSITAND